ncbi:MAG: endonuclease/exonuclease/phosphatase family protein [Phycisphaerales bacterium]|nr:endonuclease/exonuclease/phosphatase family protein [Phycisphaerales bacterium]
MIIKLTLSLLTLLSGCAATQLSANSSQPATPTLSDPLPPPVQIVLDGELDDWYGQTGIRADQDEVFICFESFDPAQAIQAANFTTRIRIDADDDRSTGDRQMYQMTNPEHDSKIMLSQGVDLRIDISPAGREWGELRGGAKLTSIESGKFTTIGHADAGFYFLPTHNAPKYEARIDRSKLPMLQHDGPVSIVIEHLAIGGDVLKTQSFSTTLPTYRPDPDSNEPITPKPTQGVRVMSTNVLYSSPLKDPDPFTRIHNALDPDVVLYQEWFKTTRDDVNDWVEEQLGDGWRLIMPDERSGVAIATKLKVVETVSKPLVAHRSDRPSRVVAAIVESHSQDQLIVLSIHLKCCGGAGSDEDAKRIAQAHQIRGLIHELREDYPHAGVVIGGDFNLVGSREPLEMMIQGIGVDEQDLVPLPTRVIGTQSMLTWTQASSSYTPGRLDWIVVDDHAWKPIRSWSLDTEELSEHVLEATGLMREDSRSSDHLPIVADLVPIQ